MDQQLIEQLGCYLGDRVAAETLGDPPDKDAITGMIADFFTESGVPHQHAMVDKLRSYDPVEHSDEWNPYEAFAGNMDDAYYGGIRDGEAQLAAELRDLLGIELK